MIEQLFDGLLALLIVWLGWRAVTDRDSLRAVVTFIALGLMLALTWLRLRAPDLALAEAAVGAGLTGALLLASLRRWQSRAQDIPVEPEGRRIVIRKLLAGTAGGALFGLLAWGLHHLPAHPAGLTAQALAALPRSGVSNPVTAALLNYRGYDTLLEIAVLLLAVIGVWSLRAMPVGGPEARGAPVLGALLRLIVPLLLLLGGYLLWIGAFAPGGAFQGGALLGGALVLLLLGGLGGALLGRAGLWRVALSAGLVVFIAIGAASMAVTGALLQYPEGLAGTLILAIESAALVSIGLTLGAMFHGGRPVRAAGAAGDE